MIAPTVVIEECGVESGRAESSIARQEFGQGHLGDFGVPGEGGKNCQIISGEVPIRRPARGLAIEPAGFVEQTPRGEAGNSPIRIGQLGMILSGPVIIGD